VSEGVLHVGQVVSDRYVVESILGIGGLAEVYRVRHQQLGSLHAMKVLTIRRKGFDERLVLEGKIQAQLRHPNVVAVTDIVQVDGQPGLVMEFVDGPTLEAHLQVRGRFSVDEALSLMTPVLAAVANAHAAGAVHRDLKPANVLLARTAVGFIPKVADFGIGKLVDGSDSVEGNPRANSTRAGMAMGTAGYISPEQVRDSSTVDVRTDVFALGVMLYELVSGQLPYTNPDGSTDITTTLVRDLVPLTTLAPATPPHVADAIHAAVAKEAADRPATVLALAAALGVSGNPAFIEPSGGGVSVSRAPASVSTAGRAAPTSNVTSGSGAGAAPVAPRPAASPPMSLGGLVVMMALPLALVLVGVAGLAAAGSAWLAMGSGEDDVPPVPTPAPIAAPLPGEPPPAPLAPEPPAPEPVASVSTAPDPAPATPRPAPPEPGPAPAPEPEPGVAPEPAPEPAPDPEPAPVPEPAPAPAPAPAPSTTTAPAPAPRPTVSAAGRWTGTANGRPLTLTLTSTTSNASGEMLFPPNRSVKVSGSFDPASGELHLQSADGIRVDGRVSAGSLDGSYSMGGAKSVPFSLSR
jgi:hypothetical protein